MNILLVYATNSGGTLTAAQLTMDILTQGGHSVTLQEAKTTTGEQIEKAEAVILASPSWDYEDKEGMPHEDFFPLMKSLEGKTLEGKPFAVLGLGDKSYAIFCGAVDHLEKFVAGLKGKLVAPSLRIDGFFFDQTKNMELVTAWAKTLVF